MNYIMYSAVSAENISEYLGKPEYSYYFVLKKYIPVFEKLGDVIVVHSFVAIEEMLAEFDDGEVVVICCAPPNKSYINSRVKVVNIFAWEFDNLPNEVWESDVRQNWEYVLSQHAGAITLSNYSQQAVYGSLGADYPVAVIPVPIWDDFQSLYLADANPVKDPVIIEVDGSIVESSSYRRADDCFDVDPAKVQISRERCPNQITLDFNVDSPASGYIGGFYEPEEWGAWSKHSSPWILFPYELVGEFTLTLKLNAYGNNVGRKITVEIDGQKKSFVPKSEFDSYDFTFNVSRPALIIRFSQIDVEAIEGAVDERSMGIGLSSLTVTRGDNIPESSTRRKKAKLTLSGVVYTTVFNPDDDRKNWQDIVKAFCFAFRDRSDARLVLKVTHHSLGKFLGRFHYLLSSLGDFSCNVIVVHGYLDKAEFNKLIQATSFYINASKCEGLCMPLMEYMAAGIPAVATNNTAMMDYFNDSVGFVVESDKAPSIWPHDPRQLYKTIQYRIDWMSLVKCLEESYFVATSELEKYRLFSNASTEAIRNFASFDVVVTGMSRFISSLSSESK